MTSIFDCIVVGAGIAGMTSSIYLKRAGLNVLLLEKSAPGGQINMSPNVENYPGFINIEGAILASNVFEQTQNLNIEYKYGNVLSIKKDENIFKIKTDIEELSSKSVIIATGRKVEKLNLKHEEELIGKGISYCVLCDGNFFKNQCVSIVGNDYKVLEEALYLANICKQINIICESDNIENVDSLIKQINKFSNIKIYYNSKISELIQENEHLKSIRINNEKIIDCNGLFISNRNVAQLDFENNIENINNYIIVNSKMETNIAGLFACGDIIKKEVYQLTTAIGEATIAANSVIKYLGR